MHLTEGQIAEALKEAQFCVDPMGQLRREDREIFLSQALLQLSREVEEMKAKVASSYAEAIEVAAKAANDFGAEREIEVGLTRGTQDLFRCRERIRALPNPYARKES